MKAFNVRTVLGAISAASTRFAAKLVSVLVVAFFVCAHTYAQDARSLRVYYPFDNAVVSDSYLGNHPTLIKVDSVAAAAIGIDDYNLTIISYSSPEGNYEYNKALSTRRAAALRNYIIKKHPELKGRIKIDGKGESWDDLRQAVETDSNLSAKARSAMLRIINSNASPDSKEEQLKQFDSYWRLYRAYFRRFRYAEIQFDGIEFDANGNVVIPGKTAGQTAGEGAGQGAGAGVAAGSTDKTAGQATGEGAEQGAGAGVAAGSTDKTAGQTAGEGAGQTTGEGAGQGAGEGVAAGSTDKTAGQGAGEGAGKTAGEGAGQGAGAGVATGSTDKTAGQGAGAGVVAGSTDKAAGQTSGEGAGQTAGEGAGQGAGAGVAAGSTDKAAGQTSGEGAGQTAGEGAGAGVAAGSTDKTVGQTAGEGAGQTAGEGAGQGAGAGVAAGSADKTAGQTSGEGAGQTAGEGAGQGAGAGVATGSSDKTAGLGAGEGAGQTTGEGAGQGAGAGVAAGSTDKTAGQTAGEGAEQGAGAGVVAGSNDKTAGQTAGEGAGQGAGEGAGQGAGAGVGAGSTDKTAGAGAGQTSGEGAGQGAGAGVVADSTDKTAAADSTAAGKDAGAAAGAAGAAGATTQKDSSDVASSHAGAGALNINAGVPERASADATSKKFRNSSNRDNILFETQKTDINPDYEGNDELFAEIAKFLESHTPEEFDSLVVVSGCSIDGPTATNERVSRQRGQALYDWINKNYPQYKDKLHMDSRGEDWDKFRESIVLDKDLDDDAKSRILTIIDSDDTPAHKEERLRELPEWDSHIKDNVLPQNRYSGLRSVFTKKEEPKPEPVAPEAPELEDVEIAEDTLAVSDTTMLVPTDTLVVDKITTPEKKYPLFAAGSNLLYDLAITPNIHAELPIGKKWSVYADYTFPWWLTRDNSRAYQMLKWDLGARRYLNRMDENDPMDILRGHFLGLDLSAGYYDFEPHHKGVQGEFQLAGLEYGYTWKMGDNWRLEAVIGAGFMGTHYRSYKADATDRHLIYQKSEKLYWFGPTKAGISVKYIFDHYKKDKQGR